jgi:hypothetical protein
MVDFICHWSRTHASRLICVKTPSLLLPFLNCPSDILVMFNFHTFIFFQLYHLFVVYMILTISFISTATSLWVCRLSILFWKSFSNLFDVSTILLERITSFPRESKRRMWLSLDELFGYFDITSVFKLPEVSGQVSRRHLRLSLKKEKICALNNSVRESIGQCSRH